MVYVTVSDTRHVPYLNYIVTRMAGRSVQQTGNEGIGTNYMGLLNEHV
jgi:hypothetical protein